MKKYLNPRTDPIHDPIHQFRTDPIHQFLKHQANKLGVNDLVPAMHVRVYSEYRKLVLDNKITGKKPWQHQHNPGWDTTLRNQGNSDILRENMRKSGIPVDLEDAEPHHIVPTGNYNHYRQEARDAIVEIKKILANQTPPIHLNEPANGVMLPKSRKVHDSYKTAYGDGMGPAHKPVHTADYFVKLYEELKDLDGTGVDMRDELQKIAVRIVDDEFK